MLRLRDVALAKNRNAAGEIDNAMKVFFHHSLRGSSALRPDVLED
jgi:hypothetical protein